MSETSSEVSPPAQPQASEAAPQMNSREELLTDMLFGVPEVMDPETATDVHTLIGPVGRLVFDPGLGMRREFKHGQEQFQAPRTDTLRRSAFVHLINKWSVRRGKPIVSIYLGDIAGLRNADLMRDPEGNSAADILLNRTAAAVQKPLDEAGLNEEHMAYACRYGGDEFAVALLGNWTVQERAELNRAIPASVGAIKELPSELKPVKLKNDHLQRIDRPPEGLDRDMFDWFLKRGLILDEESIKRIHDEWGLGTDHRRAFEEYRLANTKNIYPPEIIDADHVAKAAFLSSKHAEFADSIKAAGRLDEKLKAGTTYRQGITEFIENVVYDQLLGENFYTFDDFQEHISMGNIDGVHVYDMKFIKEINDNLGLVRGDEVIQEFWESTIKPQIHPQDLEKLMFGRRGGTIFLGVRAGAGGYPALQESTRRMLTGGVDSAQIDGATVPVGYSSAQVEHADNGNSRLRLAELFAKSDRQWYDRIALDLASSAKNGGTALDQIQTGSANLATLPVVDDHRRLSRENLTLHYFLSPKRAVERNQHLTDAVNRQIPVIDVRDKNNS